MIIIKEDGVKEISNCDLTHPKAEIIVDGSNISIKNVKVTEE